MTDDGPISPDDATQAFGERQSASAIVIPGYRVLRALGRGGMGTVYLAEDETLGRRVAIKVIAHGIAEESAIRQRFLREARLLATIEHPNVVRIYSFGASEDRAYIVMEYIEGETLADRIRRGPIAPAAARTIVGHVVDALAAAWEKKIVHRDIKPTNILFDQRGDVKVADFGLAKGVEPQKDDASLTQAGYLLGSPHYIAPEQAQGRETDFRADIYSLGVTLFEMLSGRRPFEDDSALAIIARHLHEELPSTGDDMARLVAWMTAKKPEQRPSSYDELREALNDVPWIGRTPRRGLRRVLLAASLLCFAASLALFVFFYHRAARNAPMTQTRDDRPVIAVAPFWGPDAESAAEGRSMAALVQQQIVTRLGRAAKVIGIDETRVAVRDPDSARALGERLNATAVIWGQAFALHNEREIQPSLTLVARKRAEMSNSETATSNPGRNLSAELPSAPEALRVQAQAANQIELRKISAEGIGDLVAFVAAMHALSQNEPQRALELLAQTRRTPDALYQKAICLAQMQRDDDAARELNEALKIDPVHAQSLALLADIDARASRFADAAARLRAAVASGRRFTTSEVALYNGLMYLKEYWRVGPNDLRDVATMLAFDPVAGRVVGRWELPGPARVFSVDDSGMTVKCDLGPPFSGELTTLRFARDHFEGEPLPHAMPLIGRLSRMRPGWYYAQNFQRDLGGPGLKLLRPQFQYSPIDAEPNAPATLPALKAALEQAIARDPTQPWYHASLALTLWALGDRGSANRVIDKMFAQPNRGTPYYEFAWMIRHFEPLGHRDWADRAYAEALERRKAEGQPIVMTATLERILDAPFIRRTAFISAVHPDPARDHLWLTRARELTGYSWHGDEIASAAWARYLRAHGDVRATAEEKVRDETRAMFGGPRTALAIVDIARAAQFATIAALVSVLTLAFFRRREAELLTVDARWALLLLATALIVTGAARLVAASRARLVESIPVPIADSLGHPTIVATLDQILTTRDTEDLRFIAAVAHQMAGDRKRAADLYRALESQEAAENLRTIDSSPNHMPDSEMLTRAFHRTTPDEVWETFKAGWGRRPAAGTMYAAAYDASQAFHLSLWAAVAVLLFVGGAGPASRHGMAFAVGLIVAGVVFAIFAFAVHRSETARVEQPVSGKYSALWTEPPGAYPFPPDPTAGDSMKAAVASSAAMRLFYASLVLAVLAAAGGLVIVATNRARPRT